MGDIKGGKVEYRADRTGNVHLIIGKKSFEEPALLQNYLAVVDEIMKSKPSSAKGRYIKSLAVSSTMGPSVKIVSAHEDRFCIARVSAVCGDVFSFRRRDAQAGEGRTGR